MSSLSIWLCYSQDCINSCFSPHADIRERFYYIVLVSIVTLRNLTEFNWNLGKQLHTVTCNFIRLMVGTYWGRDMLWARQAARTPFVCTHRTQVAGKVRWISSNMLRAQTFFTPTELFCKNGRVTRGKVALQHVPVYIHARLYPLVCANLWSGREKMSWIFILCINTKIDFEVS